MISDYCKMEWEELSKSAKRKTWGEALKAPIVGVLVPSSARGNNRGRGKKKKNPTRTGFVFGRAPTKVCRPICCLNGVANVTQATDELNISPMWAWQLLCLIRLPLVAAISEPQRPTETRHHLLPFFGGLPCLAEILHCPDGPSESRDLKLGVKANIRETLFFFFFLPAAPRCTYRVILLIEIKKKIILFARASLAR